MAVWGLWGQRRMEKIYTEKKQSGKQKANKELKNNTMEYTEGRKLVPTGIFNMCKNDQSSGFVAFMLVPD